MIRRFVEDHAHKQVSLADLARAMNLSATHTCHLVKFHFGKSFHALLCDTRMARARNLLRSTDMPIKMVAAVVGFDNEFYFNRIFARECGMPPGEFRKKIIHERESMPAAVFNPSAAADMIPPAAPAPSPARNNPGKDDSPRSLRKKRTGLDT